MEVIANCFNSKDDVTFKNDLLEYGLKTIKPQFLLGFR